MSVTEAIVSSSNLTTTVLTTTLNKALRMFVKSGIYRQFEEAVYFALKVMVYQTVNQRFGLGRFSCLRKWFFWGVEMRAESTDPIYAWITAWMKDSPEWKRNRAFEVSSEKSGVGVRPYITFNLEGKGAPDERGKVSEANFNPMSGVEYNFRFGRYTVKIKRQGVENSGASSNDKTVYLVRIVKGNYEVLNEFVSTAKQIYLDQLKGFVSIYQAELRDRAWLYLKSNEKRDLSTVHLEGNRKEELLRDVEEFLSRRHTYEQRGIPYRRGYLLHGPPGTGKTTIVTALAGHLDLKVHVLHISLANSDDSQLNVLMAGLPEKSIVLLEDIDRTFLKATTTAGGKSEAKGVTLGGLMNVMDGLCAAKGQLLFVTTNNKNALEKALLRPGRLDVQVKFGYATKDMAKRFFWKYFSVGTMATVDEIAVLATQFSDRLQDGFTMADLQDYLLRYDADPEGAVEQFTEWQEGVLNVPSFAGLRSCEGTTPACVSCASFDTVDYGH